MERARKHGTKSGKPIGQPPLSEAKVEAIRAELARGTGIIKTARLCGTGVSAVHGSSEHSERQRSRQRVADRRLTFARGRALIGWSPRNHPFCPALWYTALCRSQPLALLAQKVGPPLFSPFRVRMRGPRQIR